MHCCSSCYRNVSRAPIITLNCHGNSTFPLESSVPVIIVSHVIIKLFTWNIFVCMVFRTPAKSYHFQWEKYINLLIKTNKQTTSKQANRRRVREMFWLNYQWAGKKVVSHFPQNPEMICLSHVYKHSASSHTQAQSHWFCTQVFHVSGLFLTSTTH